MQKCLHRVHKIFVLEAQKDIVLNTAAEGKLILKLASAKVVWSEWNGFDWFRTKFVGRLL